MTWDSVSWHVKMTILVKPLASSNLKWCMDNVPARSMFWFYSKFITHFQDDCLFGCPCDSYQCQPDSKSVLVLNTYESNNVPVLIKFNGKIIWNWFQNILSNISRWSKWRFEIYDGAKYKCPLFLFRNIERRNVCIWRKWESYKTSWVFKWKLTINVCFRSVGSEDVSLNVLVNSRLILELEHVRPINFRLVRTELCSAFSIQAEISASG